MKLVEVVNAPHCDRDTVDVSFKLCEKLGKIPVTLNYEIDDLFLTGCLELLQKRPSGCMRRVSPHLRILTKHVFTARGIQWGLFVLWISQG